MESAAVSFCTENGLLQHGAEPRQDPTCVLPIINGLRQRWVEECAQSEDPIIEFPVAVPRDGGCVSIALFTACRGVHYMIRLARMLLVACTHSQAFAIRRFPPPG